MHWPTLAVSDYIALLSMLGAGLVTIFKFIQKIRTNDLTHLDMKIDMHHQAMSELVNEMKTTVERVDGKMDQHLHDHAVGAFSHHDA